MNRRRYLTVVVAVAVSSFAGWGDSDSGPLRETIDEYPAVGSEHLSRLEELGGHAVLASEDPSYESCATFHKGTVPEIQSNIVKLWLGAYVLRTSPVVFPCAETERQALETTCVRDDDMFWLPLGYYFERRSQFLTDKVFDRSETVLADSNGLNAAAVVDDDSELLHENAVQSDINTTKHAEFGQTLPVTPPFNNGKFIIKTNQSVSYDLTAEALEVG